MEIGRLEGKSEKVSPEAKGLYTYAAYICSIVMFGERFRGLRIAVANSAMRELIKEEKTLNDVIRILKHGYDAPRKWKPDTIEKWLDKGSKTFNAVVVKDYDEVMRGECWVLIHFGKFGRRKRK